jgi:hypothetical protein
MPTQITRIRNSDGSQTLRRHSDGTTLPYSEANLTTLLSGVPNPIFVLMRIDTHDLAYPFTLQARSRAEFETSDFDTVWNLLIANPDRAFKL